MPITSCKATGKWTKLNARFPSRASYEKVKKAAAMCNLTLNEFVTSRAIESADAILASQQLSNQPQAVNQ